MPIVPMPLHWRRGWERGFNQSELLAREIAKKWNVPLQQAVRRVKSTAPQAGLTNAKRRTNVAGAFAVKKNVRLDGARVLLVDDVLTTGATAAACARALKRAGAAHVALLALARTDRRVALSSFEMTQKGTRMRPRPRGRGNNVIANHHQERLHRPVLVLNSSYEPINVCAARRALVLVLKGVAADGGALEFARAFRAAGNAVPSVIRLLEYRRIPMQARSLSRKNILMRDRYTCQYCHRTFSTNELTLDHVIPRSRAGETTWENLVACCHPCNNRKGSRTPDEAGMRLARAPRPFSLHTSRHLMRLLGKSDDQWRKYLFY